MYIVFRVTPFSKNIARSILKEPKIYFYDTGLVRGSEGARFENCVALSLLKHAWGRTDLLGQPCALNYLRTKDGAEVDFCLVREDHPERLIEVKRSDSKPAPALVNFQKRYDIPSVQAVLHLKREKIERGIEIRKGMNFLSQLKR